MVWRWLAGPRPTGAPARAYDSPRWHGLLFLK